MARVVKRGLEDFQVGERIMSPAITITESAIIDFALTFDPQPFHIDAVAAARSPFEGLIASGFHSLALAFRAIWQTGFLDQCGLGSPGMNAVRWLRPVRPGDTIRTEAEVRAARRSRSRNGAGVLDMTFTVRNQNNDDVLRFEAVILVKTLDAQ